MKKELLLTLVIGTLMGTCLVGCLKVAKDNKQDTAQAVEEASQNMYTQEDIDKAVAEALAKAQAEAPKEEPKVEAQTTVTIPEDVAVLEDKPVFEQKDELIVDGGDFRIYLLGRGEDNGYEVPIGIRVENDTERNICVQAWDASVKGYMVDTFCSIDVVPGKKAVSRIGVPDSELDNILGNGEKLHSLDCSFHIFDTDDWDWGVDTEQVHLEF